MEGRRNALRGVVDRMTTYHLMSQVKEAKERQLANTEILKGALETAFYEWDAKSGKWEVEEHCVTDYDEDQWDRLIMGSIGFFRNLGGLEEPLRRFKLRSTSPDGLLQTIREFHPNVTAAELQKQLVEEI